MKPLEIEDKKDENLKETPKVEVRLSFWKVCCCGLPKNKDQCCLVPRFKSICQRRPSALMPLDGLRGIAVLWVVMFHAMLHMPSNYYPCTKTHINWGFRPIANGGIGVDIFFTLSGFLIGYIMLKDLETCDGKLDLLDFFRSRFLRIWPALIALTPMQAIFGVKFIQLLSQWFFFNNFVRQTNHLWSIAVEFQMYLISPFYIKWLFNNPDKAALSTGIISVCSIIITYISFSVIYKEGYDPKIAEGDYFWNVYVMPWCRISPYLFGMLAALEHRNDKERKIFENSSVIVEWIAFILFIFIGCNPWMEKAVGVFKIWSSFYRALYGMCLAHLIKLMISPAPEDPIPWHRPTRYLRSFLSWHLWVPIGNLSYSIYLWHIQFLKSFDNGDFGFKIKAPALTIEDPYKVGGMDGLTAEYCNLSIANSISTYWTLFFAGTFCTIIAAALTFALIEKPCLDARVAFKNRYR